jgi:hypothetical protein
LREAPLIVAWLFYNDRAKISKLCAFDCLLASPFVILAAILAAVSLWRLPSGTPDSTSLLTLSLVLLLSAGFIAIFWASLRESDLVFAGVSRIRNPSALRLLGPLHLRLKIRFSGCRWLNFR